MGAVPTGICALHHALELEIAARSAFEVLRVVVGRDGDMDAISASATDGRIAW